ncbi:MAG: hypothetical protein AMJ92_05265 [candidate division Zixibacteria bacterium SM23_81]|nr:MAG: hypothetical protein AMJ92_05265 [candidate division Zixibacteria bacterium SM23_81]
MNPKNKIKESGPEILLVNPWIYDFAAYDFWAKPIGLLYIAAVLHCCGYTVRLLDCLDTHEAPATNQQGSTVSEKRTFGCGKFPKEIVPKPSVYRNVPRRYGRYGITEETFERSLASTTAPTTILVTSGMTYWYPGVCRAIELLRARFPKTPVLMGGIYATLCPKHARSFSGADLVITGPGEVAAVEAVDDICGCRSNAETYGRLQALPLPAFDLYDRLDYACLLTSRGCPFQCPYCASGLLSGGYRRRLVEDVLMELEWLRRGLGVKNIAFYDDALLVDADDHIKPILEGVLQRNLDCWFHTPNGLHARMVDRELADLMFRSGFKTLRLSFDPVDAPGQERIDNKATARDLFRAVENLRQAGYRREEIGVYLLVGLPSQHYEQVIENVDVAANLGVQIKLACYSPIPGTDLWRSAVQDGLQDPQTDPLLHNNTIFPTSSPQLPAEKLEAIKKYVVSRNAALLSTRR